jgi:hypothetical protein
MGTVGTAAELGAKLHKAANNVSASSARRRAVEAAALAAKDTYDKHAAAAGLPPGSRLAGKVWNGFRFKLNGDDSAVVYAGGPVHLHNAATRPHWIYPKGERGNVTAAGPVLPGMAADVIAQGGRRRRTAGAQALKIGGSEPVENALHPGTKGKNWGKPAQAAIAKQSPEAYMRSMSTEWRAVFK